MSMPSKTLFRINDEPTIESARGNLAVAGDPYPGVADDAGFVGYNPDLPAGPDHHDNVISLLQAIRDQLVNPPKSPPFWAEFYRTIPNTTTGELVVDTPQNFQYVYVSRAPVAMNVYANRKGMFLHSLAVGENLKVKYPYPLKAITLEWTAGGGGQVGVILSTEELTIEKW